MQRKFHINIYVSLVFILIIPLLLITLYSFSDKELQIGSFVLQKADISKHFKTDPAIPVDSLVSDSITVEPKEEIIVNDTTSQRILLFGDSMVEGLSKRLRNYAAENGHELLNVIWYSSSTKIWAERDTLQHFMRTFEPTFIMLSLGGNELFVRDLDKREAYIQRILEKIGDIPFVWIGPPNWKEDTGINDLMEKHVKTYRFFPSKKLTFQRLSDGAHPTLASSAQWMDSVAVWMNTDTRYRIKMDFPQTAEQKGRTVVLQPLR